MESKDVNPENLEPEKPESTGLEPVSPKPKRPKRSGQRKSAIEIASMARGYTETVIKMLVGMVVREDISPTVRINAGLALLDRGWGKPLQKVELEGDRPTQITEIINYIVDPKDPVSPIRMISASGQALREPEGNEATAAPEENETEADAE